MNEVSRAKVLRVAGALLLTLAGCSIASPGVDAIESTGPASDVPVNEPEQEEVWAEELTFLDDSEPSNRCWIRCCDGSLFGPYDTGSGLACIDVARGVCERHGHVKRVKFNGDYVYIRPDGC